MRERILEISEDEGLTHVGSNLSALPIIREIYALKKEGDSFVLSSGHAHLAHAIVRGDENMNAGIHCDKANGCEVSTGSLGSGLPIALGMAIADREHIVYCLISDGETREGSVWEALRIKTDMGISNLHIYVNCNGWGAYDPIDIDELEKRLEVFCPDINIRRTKSDFEGGKGQMAHYARI